MNVKERPYLETYWKAPSTLISSNVALFPNMFKASGAWTAIMHPSCISCDPSPQNTVQPAKTLTSTISIKFIALTLKNANNLKLERKIIQVNYEKTTQ